MGLEGWQDLDGSYAFAYLDTEGNFQVLVSLVIKEYGLCKAAAGFVSMVIENLQSIDCSTNKSALNPL